MNEQTQSTRIVADYLRAFLEENDSAGKLLPVLSMREVPEAIQSRPNPKVSTPLPDPAKQRVFDRFSDAFSQLRGRVLLLGATGSGKTTTILRFACDMAGACLEDANIPVPIMRNVADWTPDCKLIEWAQAPTKARFPGINLENRTLLIYF